MFVEADLFQELVELNYMPPELLDVLLQLSLQDDFPIEFFRLLEEDQL